MFFGKKGKEKLAAEYDKEGKKPVIRASICTGEKTAGFRNVKTGQIEELMLITGEKDLERFMELYGVEREEIETVW
ncbi:MAG: aspartate dehydrogenase [Lachnospiraceae bacterium]|nr:aspartate dehydrogenase [Lachnospiraceae bacterium]